MNKDIIPEVCRSAASKNFMADIEGWRNFAQRITKNPFVKDFLLERDGNTCSWCNNVLQEIKIIHHTTYNHCCTYNKVIRITSSTVNNPHGTRLVSDCKSCKEENDGRFMACVEKLVLVHSFCNKIIAEETYFIKENKIIN